MISRMPDRRAMRGAAAPSRLIAAAILVVILAAGAWWFFGRTPGTAVAPGTATAPTAATTPASPTAPTPVVSDELTTDQLYREARKAMGENRMAVPAGNNALEFYLKIVAKQPDDSGAKDALRELFPFATGAAEDQINQGAYDEANRIIALLAQADPSNYSLTILRSKLDAKRKLADREQQQAQLAATAAAAARQAAGTATTPTPGTPAGATTPPAADATATTAAATPAAAAPAAADTAVASTTPPPRPAPAPAPAPAAPSGETRDAAVTSPPVPVYPIAAARARQEGWVEVEFVVGADGSVQNARVTGSNPTRIFDREAIAAVQRAKFQPRVENGQAVASTLRRRIEFKLGN